MTRPLPLRSLSKTIIFFLFLSGCSQSFLSSSRQLLPEIEPVFSLTKSRFDQIPGWGEGQEKQALKAFLKSCKILNKLPAAAPVMDPRRGLVGRLAGNGKHWREVCSKARELGPNLLSVDAKNYFENWFIPYQMSDRGQEEGLVTGYYEPVLRGSRTPTPRFKFPLYKRPNNLVSVDLGSFKEKWNGQKVIGKVSDTKLVPYEVRGEIEKGSLKGQNLELIWVDDPVDAFFLHIQGSGRIVLRDGRSVRVGYAGKNGHPYFAIGRHLVAQGILPKDRVSQQSIGSWLRAHPGEAQNLMNKNKSYIFFRMLKGPGPIGAQGIPLTPGHSLAVDRRFVPLGVPLWLDTIDPLSLGAPLRRLVIAQDTGSAIKGVIRADLFWGAGVKARQGAGQMKEMGSLHMLLPRSAILED